jgi:hypothetical protein
VASPSVEVMLFVFSQAILDPMKTRLHILVRTMAFWMALLVALPASGLDELVYFCNMTGEIGQKCGCPHEPGTPMAGMSISSTPCCELIGADDLVPPTRAEVLSLEVQSTDHLAIMPIHWDDRVLVSDGTGLTVPYGSRGPPPDTSPPIFIKHCSILI